MVLQEAESFYNHKVCEFAGKRAVFVERMVKHLMEEGFSRSDAGVTSQDSN